jgi:hypothetical protein
MTVQKGVQKAVQKGLISEYKSALVWVKKQLFNGNKH